VQALQSSGVLSKLPLKNTKPYISLKWRNVSQKKKQKEAAQAHNTLDKLRNDMQKTHGQTVVLDGKKLNMKKMDLEEEEEDQYEHSDEDDDNY